MSPELQESRSLRLRRTHVALVASLALAGCSPAGDGFTGGCPTFVAYAQNRYSPLGAAVRSEPSTTSSRLQPGFAPNEIVAINGWVETEPAYPTNPAPYNSAVWFHLADKGWVSFPAVRAGITSPDNTVGDEPVPTTAACHGSYEAP